MSLLAKLSVKKIIISVLSGIAVFVVTWFYINSYYTLGIEDDLLSRETWIKHKLIKGQPEKNQQFVFISTGKDLNLVDDTAGYGNISVSDRYKLYKLLQAINNSNARPKYILLDLQFYLPYIYSIDDSVQQKIKKANLPYFFPDKRIDDSLQVEVKRTRKLAISVLLNSKNTVDTPLIKGTYGIADYKTYGSFINKFRVYYGNKLGPSVPGLLHERIDGVTYSGNWLATYCNDRLCFNYIWPDYYEDEDNVKTNQNYQVYHIGSLSALLNNPKVISTTFKDKVVLIGNYEEDVHDTPAGRIPGTIILADIYLSLLNGRHYVPYLWVLFVIVVFSWLSYVSIYNALPDIKFKRNFAFAEQILDFVKQYVSYVGMLMLLSILSILIFNINISLFLPAFIFSIIDFFTQKKYKPKHEKI